MFLGGLAAELLRRFSPSFGARYTTAVASGLIAGESLMGVAVVVLKVGDVLAM